jgi:Icc-related predicted phosphoesterase
VSGLTTPIRIAAVGDIHVGPEPDPAIRTALAAVDDCADVLLLAGDLSRHGTADEAAVVVDAVGDVSVPVVVVLGNHDHESSQPDRFIEVLEEGGVTVLEGGAVVVDTPGGHLGVAGVKGFGGGFAGVCASDFGEPEMKAFIGHTRDIAATLRTSLASLECDARVALLHYSPVDDTLQGEPLQIHPFLGSYLLAEAIDEAGADLALHGHAHRGSEQGVTPGGVRVRNVAQPVIRAPFRVFEIEPRSPAWSREAGGEPQRLKLRGAR